MGLLFHPPTGTIVVCDYGLGFRAPEMVKIRPVIVVSPRFRSRPNLCTVVPLSSTEPKPQEMFHHQLSDGAYPPARGPMWAKCDMLATVSLDRLDRIKTRGLGGKREYVVFEVPADDLAAIQVCIRFALGLLDK
ncbi:MAG: type II toxin-antitoxin system PemK/MazF family toxin [Alphaproteobacteria bacterium]|nr:type II toxin-antitoxin system PemK/MazF family toxin [Alphaproteobacteria bacterium]